MFESHQAIQLTLLSCSTSLVNTPHPPAYPNQTGGGGGGSILIGRKHTKLGVSTFSSCLRRTSSVNAPTSSGWSHGGWDGGGGGWGEGRSEEGGGARC